MATTTAVSEIEEQFEFLGWGLETVTRAPVPLFCDEGSYLETSGDWARCCNSENCAFATECQDDTLYFDDSSRQTCVSSCLTISILASSPADEDAQTTTRIACFTDWSVDTEIYRQFPTNTNTDENGSLVTDLPDSSTISDRTSATSEISSTTGGNDSNDDTGDDAVGSTNSTSQAWIAGAVIGPVALIAISAVIFWFLRKRLRKREAQAPVEAPTDPPRGQPQFSPATSDLYKYGGPQMSPAQPYTQGSMSVAAPTPGSDWTSQQGHSAQGPPSELPGDMAYLELPGDNTRSNQ